MDDIEVPSFAAQAVKPTATPVKRGRQSASQDTFNIGKQLGVNSTMGAHIGQALVEAQGPKNNDETFHTAPLNSLATKVGRAKERADILAKYDVADEHKLLPLAELADTYEHTLASDSDAFREGHSVLAKLEKRGIVDIKEREKAKGQGGGKQWEVQHPVLSTEVPTAVSGNDENIGLGFHPTKSLYEADTYYKGSSHAKINQLKSLPGGLEGLKHEKSALNAMNDTQSYVNPEVAGHYQDILNDYQLARKDNKRPVSDNLAYALQNPNVNTKELRGNPELSLSGRQFPDRSAPHSQGDQSMKVLTGFPKGNVGTTGRDRLLTNIEDTGVFNVPEGQTLDQYLNANRQAIENRSHSDFVGEHTDAVPFERQHYVKTKNPTTGKKERVPVNSLDPNAMSAYARAKEFYKQEDAAKAKGMEPGQWHPEQKTTMPVGLDYSYDNIGHLAALYQHKHGLTDTMAGLDPDADSKFKTEIGSRMQQLANNENAVVYARNGDTQEVKPKYFQLQEGGERRPLDDSERRTIKEFLDLKSNSKAKPMVEATMKLGNNIVGYGMSSHKMYEILMGEQPDAGTGLHNIPGYLSDKEKQAIQTKKEFFQSSSHNEDLKTHIADLRKEHFGDSDLNINTYSKRMKAQGKDPSKAVEAYKEAVAHPETGTEAKRKESFGKLIKDWEETHPVAAKINKAIDDRTHNDAKVLTNVISQLSNGISPVGAFHRYITGERAKNLSKIDREATETSFSPAVRGDKLDEQGNKVMTKGTPKVRVVTDEQGNKVRENVTNDKGEVQYREGQQPKPVQTTLSPKQDYRISYGEHKEGPRQSYITFRNHEGGVGTLGIDEIPEANKKNTTSDDISRIRKFTAGNRTHYSGVPNVAPSAPELSSVYQRFQGAAGSASKLAPYQVQSLESGGRNAAAALEHQRQGIPQAEYVFDAIYHTPELAEKAGRIANQSQAKLAKVAPTIHDQHLQDDIAQADAALESKRITPAVHKDIVRTAHRIREQIAKFANVDKIPHRMMEHSRMKLYQDGGLV